MTLTDALDRDCTLIRGVAGEKYAINAYSSTTGAETDLRIGRYTNPANCPDPQQPFGCVIEPLYTYYFDNSTEIEFVAPADDWYSVCVQSRTPTSQPGEYSVSLYRFGIDEYSNTIQHAQPLSNDEFLPGQTASPPFDVDYFSTYVPFAGFSSANLEISATGATFDVINPLGMTVASNQLTSWSTTNAMEGLWRWVVRSGSTSYLTGSHYECASSGTTCFDSSENRATASSTYGGEFAGRLESSTQWLEYGITLQEEQNVAAALSFSSNCELALEVYPPSGLNYFGSLAGRRPMFRWTNGSAFAAVGNDARPGPGGHWVAPVAGAYVLRVVSDNNSGCDRFRLNVATNGSRELEMPAW